MVARRSRALVVATVNVNGLRAAHSNGMGGWVSTCGPDVITMQEVRAPDTMVPELVETIAGRGWHVTHDECAAKGRAGVAVASRSPIVATRRGLPTPDGGDRPYDDTGRWVEADLVTPDGRALTVVSAYVHTGDAESPTRMAEKLAFLSAAGRRLDALRTAGSLVLLTGDLNVAHREADLKNWKGNLKSAGFLPEERAWFDTMFAGGWVDVVRTLSGDGPGPYTWWSWRGKAFDVDSGWRIDYQIADPALAAHARVARIDRAPTYAERWSDHAPCVVRYEF